MEAVLDEVLAQSSNDEIGVYYFWNDLVKAKSQELHFSNQFDAPKFDSSAKLPDKMKKFGFYILNLGTRDGRSGTHAFIRGGKPIPGEDYPGYHNFEKIESTEHVRVKRDLLSYLGKSEAQTSSNLFNYGIIQRFLGIPPEKKMIIHVGRRTRVSFTIRVPAQHKLVTIQARKVQIEIDTLYEYDNTVVHVEIKNSESDDFSIHQLFTPRYYIEERLKDLSNLEGERPKVRSIYAVGLIGSAPLYRLYEYTFEEPDRLNSIKFFNSKQYVVDYV